MVAVGVAVPRELELSRRPEARLALPRALERLASSAAASLRRRVDETRLREVCLCLGHPRIRKPPSLRVGVDSSAFLAILRGRRPVSRGGGRGRVTNASRRPAIPQRRRRGGHRPSAAVLGVAPLPVPRADVHDVAVPKDVRGRDGVPVEPERHVGRVARRAEVRDDGVRERNVRSRTRTSRRSVPHAEILRRAPVDRHQTRVDVEAQTRRVPEIRLAERRRRRRDVALHVRGHSTETTPLYGSRTRRRAHPAPVSRWSAGRLFNAEGRTAKGILSTGN